METNDKHIEDQNQFWAMLPFISKFPRLHNAIKADFKLLLEMTEHNKADKAKFEMLCRTCIKDLFALIEADIHYYNLFDKYPGYEDKHRFVDRFKNTFIQICGTWKKEQLQKEYFGTRLQDLLALKEIRDQLVHPKELAHIIQPNEKLFEMVKKVFTHYDAFITAIMNNFFFSTTINI